jgi:hypothetical protein
MFPIDGRHFRAEILYFMRQCAGGTLRLGQPRPGWLSRKCADWRSLPVFGPNLAPRLGAVDRLNRWSSFGFSVFS